MNQAAKMPPFAPLRVCQGDYWKILRRPSALLSMTVLQGIA